MILLPLSSFHLFVVTPVDLLDQIYAKKGFAFVPATNRTMNAFFHGRKGDPVVITNLVRRWNLRYRPEQREVTAVALPLQALFPSDAYLQDRYRRFEPKEFRRVLLSRSGGVLRVRELLANAGVAPERCHWLFWDRLILARVDPDRIESALPHLAVTIGAKYDAKVRRIEFDPHSFRALFNKSADEHVAPTIPGHPSWLPLARLTVNSVDDARLKEIYADPSPKLVDLPLVGGRPHPVLTTYIEKRIEALRKDGHGQFADLDPDVAPKIEYFPLSVVSVRLTKKDGSAVVF